MGNGELGGVVIPVITPVDSDERIDEAAFRGGIRRLIGAGVHAIFVGGSAGEGPLLTAIEWERMVTIAHDEVGGAVHLLGGAIDTSTRRVLEKIRILSQLGFPYTVVTPTYYITLRTPDEHLRLFGECVEHAGNTEIIAYNIPSCTGSAIPAETVIEMARRGWIRTMKESSGDFDYFRRLAVEGAEYGLRLLQGDEPHIAAGLLAGAVGIVPVCANFEPATYIAAYEAGIARDAAALGPLQERILYIREKLLLSSPLWIAGIKYAMSCLGLGSGMPISPLYSLTAVEQQKIADFVLANRPA